MGSIEGVIVGNFQSSVFVGNCSPISAILRVNNQGNVVGRTRTCMVNNVMISDADIPAIWLTLVLLDDG